MIVDSGELKGLYVEEPMKFDVSSAESILEKL
jgi:peroxiredoxin